ncbi:hypothetical protein ACFFIX_26965 [Metabacillus herbersteinensis]|uniref:Uncharacterized protein n=1 Tax=Metabacillus herbersteinensis TaxID=283816 RepID=A0ABV6GMN7_9BACI
MAGIPFSIMDEMTSSKRINVNSKEKKSIVINTFLTTKFILVIPVASKFLFSTDGPNKVASYFFRSISLHVGQ